MNGVTLLFIIVAAVLFLIAKAVEDEPVYCIFFALPGAGATMMALLFFLMGDNGVLTS